jgi:hypothetical protein
VTTTSDTTLQDGQQHPTADNPGTATATAARTAGWAAILFATLPLAVLLVPHEGIQPTDSGDAIMSFFIDNWAMQQWQPLMHSMATLAFVVFVVALERCLEPGGMALTRRVMVVTGSIMAAIWFVAMALASAAATLASATLTAPQPDGGVILGLYYAGWGVHFKTVFLAPVFLGCIAVLALRGTPRARVWGGLTAALAILSGLAAAASLTEASYVAQYPAFMLLLPWALGTGIMLLRRARQG